MAAKKRSFQSITEFNDNVYVHILMNSTHVFKVYHYPFTSDNTLQPPRIPVEAVLYRHMIGKHVRHLPMISREGYCIEDNTYELVMPKYPKTLDMVIQDSPGFDESKRLFKQLLECIHDAHAARVTHADLKPYNILVDGHKNCRVADWGHSIYRFDVTVNIDASITGTCNYRAPELLFIQEYDHSVDMWSLGIILLELLDVPKPAYYAEFFTDKSLEEELSCVVKILGVPELYKHQVRAKLPDDQPIPLPQDGVLEQCTKWKVHLSQDTKDLIHGLLDWNPVTRWTAKQALESSFFVPRVSA